MAHSLTFSGSVRSTRREVRRRADAVEIQTRRQQTAMIEPLSESTAPHRITRTEWLGVAVLWSFVAVFVIGEFIR